MRHPEHPRIYSGWRDLAWITTVLWCFTQACSLLYYRALKDAGVPADMHLYAQGGHGCGIRPTALPITNWEDLAAAWLHGLK